MKCPKCGYNTVDWARTCKKCGAGLNPKTKVKMVYPSGRGRGRENPAYKGAMGYGKTVREEETKNISYIPSQRLEEESSPRESRKYKRIIEVPAEDNQTESVEPGDSSPFLLSGDSEITSDEFIDPEDASFDKSEILKKEMISFDLAGVSSRAAAFIIDLTILLGVTAVILWAGVSFGGVSFDTGAGKGELIWTYLGLFLLSSTYFIFLHGAGGKTVGKMICKIKVIQDDGEVIGFSKAFVRWLGYFVSTIFPIGFLWAFLDSNGQAWHDKIAKTYVVKE
ncbi:MAG TPA: RDD family protein [Thermodesulfobacteriota bacterium]|nr:RDD family protein [Thermodesulfobacteriota bacterium]